MGVSHYTNQADGYHAYTRLIHGGGGGVWHTDLRWGGGRCHSFGGCCFVIIVFISNMLQFNSCWISPILLFGYSVYINVFTNLIYELTVGLLTHQVVDNSLPQPPVQTTMFRCFAVGKDTNWPVQRQEFARQMETGVEKTPNVSVSKSSIFIDTSNYVIMNYSVRSFTQNTDVDYSRHSVFLSPPV